MSGDQYLQQILAREAVDNSIFSPVHGVLTTLSPIITQWAGSQLRSITPSGSFAKGTANSSGTDIDLFISLHPTTTETLKEIHDSLVTKLTLAGYSVRKQNVSLNIRVGGYDVDLVPAKRQDAYSEDHSLYRRRADSWTKTNVQTHINYVRSHGRISETRILKLWRNQKGLDFPSFYLELTVIDALSGQLFGGVADNVWKTFQYLRDSFSNARVVDPANTNNVLSDELSLSDRQKILNAAKAALLSPTWEGIVV